MAANNFTPDQKNAINAETGTILVAAAAGSGKTSVLTQRIIRKLTQAESPVSPEQLLVVTFTKAAAAEMKSRVFDGISALMKEHPERRREYSLLQSNLSTMNICTMDSFCMKLVKENFHLLDIDADINILSEGEAKLLRKQTAEELLENMLNDSPETFSAISKGFSVTGDDSGINSVITKLSEYATSEPEPEKWLRSLADDFLATDIEGCKWRELVLRAVEAKCIYALTYLDDALTLANEFSDDKDKNKILVNLEPPANELKEYIIKLKTATWDELYSGIKTAYERFKEKFPIIKSDVEKKEIIKEKKADAKKIIEKTVKLFSATKADHKEDMEFLHPVVSAIIDTVIAFDKSLLEKKKMLKTYEFGDILHFALLLLYDSSADDKKTALAREIASGLNEIMIDEYQDTNAAQDTLFTSLSKDGENMFMVGDVKQSIYRFRLASPDIFMEKCRTFPDYDGTKKKQSKILLKENFRCRKGIVDAVNYLFSGIMSKETGGIEYNEDEKLNFGAEYYTLAGEKEEDDVYLRIIDSEDIPADEAEARFIASDIKRRLGSDLVLDKKGKRSPRPSDFAVITRSPSKISAKYKKIFEEYGLQLVSSQGESIYDFAEIRLLLSLLKMIDNPSDSISATAVMLSQFYGFTPDDLAILRMEERKEKAHGKSEIWAGVCRHIAEREATREDDDALTAKCRLFRDSILYFVSFACHSDTAELLREIDNRFAYSSTVLAMDSGDLRHNNIMLFTDYAADAALKGIKTPGGFVRYIESLRDDKIVLKSAVSSGGVNAVKMISIHGSKGLEFPYVYIANLNRDFNKNDLQTQLISNHSIGIGLKRRDIKTLRNFETIPYTAVKYEELRQMISEEIRLYYVAATRAKENLTIVIHTKNLEKEKKGLDIKLPLGCGIPSEYIVSSGSPASWFFAAFSRHAQGIALRSDGSPFIKTDSRIDIRVISRDDFFEETGENTEEIAVPESSAAEVEDIAKRAAFRYKYAPFASTLSKYTASAHFTTVADDYEEYAAENIEQQLNFSPERFAKKRPSFAYEKSKLSPVEKGTATHLFLQYCDFEEARMNLEEEIAKVVASGRLNAVQADGLDRRAIVAFLRSGLMKRIKSADHVYREKKFITALSLGEIPGNEKLTESMPGSNDESTILIGRLDLLFTENGKAVIVDYKTDRENDLEKLKETYLQQMKLYIKAVGRTMGLEVSECILYSLHLKDFISVSPDEL